MYFHPKMASHLLHMTSYLVTIATDRHWTCLKISRGMNKELLKMTGVDIFILKKKTQKKYLGGGGGIHTPSPPLNVRGLRYWQNHKGGNLFFPSFSTYLANIEILNFRVTRIDPPKSASNNTSLFVKHFSRILTHLWLFIINAGRLPIDGYRSIS